MRKPRTIKGFILAAAFVVSFILFAGLYLATMSVYGQAVRSSAVAMSDTLAQGTFNAMFQVMRQGWTRAELEEFMHSVQKGAGETNYRVDIYRGEIVSKLFGPIDQKPIVGLIADTFESGVSTHEENSGNIRYTYPLAARQECRRCHVNADVGDILGVIEVHQDVEALIADAKQNLFTSLLLMAPLPFIVAIGVAFLIQRKINRSISVLEANIEQINRVSDLTNLSLDKEDLGLEELNNIFFKVEQLSEKLKSVAVDKDLLEFEIRLLEKFVITSEVVKDWHEYVSYLLIDINKVINAYNLFSIFKIDEEVFDLEVFWLNPPSDKTRDMLNTAIRKALKKNPAFDDFVSIEVNHHVSYPDGEPLELGLADIELQTKSLFVDTPKIGGIVGIGVHADLVKDQTRILVMESILSTLLNVVGSVKAIYKYTKDLEYYATRDPLTNLYNQRLFWELLGYEVGRAERHDYPFSLLVIDMDNFKNINDSHGHSFGDRFLQAFANAVHHALRDGDILARYGGDEFVVILPEADATQAKSIAQRIVTNSSQLEMESPQGDIVKATVSIGVAVYPDHAKEMKDLFLFADNMMYKAKSEGKDRVGIADENDVIEVFRSIGEKSLIIANAIEEKRIVPYYQPIVDAISGEVAAIEVLSRLRLKDDQLLGAHEFIELAEKMGIVQKIDYVVMEKAFEAARDNNYRGMIFVNLSPRALLIGEFIREVRRISTECSIPPGQIVFEITERDTVKNIALLEKFVNELKAEGFLLAIDDFGSGFSSFHYLKRFPIDIVKIEGDFIRNMSADAKDKAFVHAIANLAAELDIRTVAEFVEDEAVLKEVTDSGITYAQGYYVCRPTPDLSQAMKLNDGH